MVNKHRIAMNDPSSSPSVADTKKSDSNNPPTFIASQFQLPFEQNYPRNPNSLVCSTRSRSLQSFKSPCPAFSLISTPSSSSAATSTSTSTTTTSSDSGERTLHSECSSGCIYRRKPLHKDLAACEDDGDDWSISGHHSGRIAPHGCTEMMEVDDHLVLSALETWIWEIRVHAELESPCGMIDKSVTGHESSSGKYSCK